jgi:hypothetical protein
LLALGALLFRGCPICTIVIEGRERHLFTLDITLYVCGSPGRKRSARASLARPLITDGDSPAHKHNFDQFRFAYQGDLSIAENMTIREGELCYHPEDVEYRPQVDEEDGTDNILLILQLGGTSGQGYLIYD